MDLCIFLKEYVVQWSFLLIFVSMQLILDSFERTLIIAEDDTYVSYLEGCTAPMRDENQLHAAIVEIIIHDRAEVKYPQFKIGIPVIKMVSGEIYNFVTKRALCKGNGQWYFDSKWETGSTITWKYPSCILKVIILLENFILLH